MSTQRQIIVKMDEKTATTLNKQRFHLFAFKGIATSAGGGGLPLVWFRTNNYGRETKIRWNETYQAYTSQTEPVTGGEITATNAYDIELGHTLIIKTEIGTGSIRSEGKEGAITVYNEYKHEFTTGIAQAPIGFTANGAASPLCAFPIYYDHSDIFTPVEKVALMFATSPFDTGTVIQQAFGSGVLIDLTGSVKERTVTYSLTDGWSPTSEVWATRVKKGDDLSRQLIKHSQELVAVRERTKILP